MTKNPRSVNLFLLIYLILYLCLSLLGDILNRTILVELIQFLPLILGILYLIISRQPLFSTIRLKKCHPLTLLLVIPFTYCLWPLISCVNALSLIFSENMINNTVSSSLEHIGFLPSLLTMAVVPALIEEFTYRGIVYGNYRCERPVKAILLSALCFGLMHMNFNQFCYAFLLGIFLASLIEATGSILPSMFMHFLFNATSISMMFVQQEVLDNVPQIEDLSEEASDIMESISIILPFVIIGCILALILFMIMAKLNHRDQEIKSWFHPRAYAERPQRKLTNIFLYCYIIICLFFCIILQFA